MNARVSRAVFAFAALLAWSAPALAHHSFAAIWDEKTEFKVTGTLTKVDWVNPHIYYYLDVKDDKGKVVTYSFEGMPPAMLRRLGFSKDTLGTVVGKTITVQAYAAQDHTKTLGFGKTITFPDGHAIQIVPDSIAAYSNAQ